MPAENKQEADKSLKSRRMAVGNGESNSISGKKRRKKKKDADSEIAGFGGAKITGGSVKDEKSTTERNKQCIRTVSNGILTDGIKSVVEQAHSSSQTPQVQSSSSTLLKQEMCSSSSSIENSKPAPKLGRFDSSDAMSVGGHTSASSLAAMDVSLPTSSLNIAASSNPPQSRSKSDNNSAPRENSTFDPDIHASVAKDSVPLGPPVIESLRWDHECSDEEKEEERIEIYKVNRRKRYENALTEKKEQLLLHSSNKTNYYFS